MHLRRWLCGMAFGGCAACAALAGIHEPSDRSTDGGDDASADGVTMSDVANRDVHLDDAQVGDAALADAGVEENGSCVGVCVPSPPLGWEGPVEVAIGSSVPTCGPAFQGSSEHLGASLDASAAECGCSCGAPTGVGCSVQLTPASTTPPCNGPGGLGTPYSVDAGECILPPPYGVLVSSPLPASGGTCPQDAATTVPPAGWSDQVIACGPTSPPASCGSLGACLPNHDPGFVACIRQADAGSCPSGSGYATMIVGYGSFTDDRGCSACSCGAPSGVVCGGVWARYSDESCATAAGVDDLGKGICEPGSGSGWSGEYQATTSGGGCVASAVQSVGEGMPTGAVTFCCMPP